MIQRSERTLTVNEIEPEYSAVRDPPVVDWFTHTQDRIPQRHQVTNGGARPEVLQVRSRGSIFTARAEVFELLFRHSIFRVQFIEISFVEPSRDRFVDIGDWRVVPEFDIFLCGIEAIDLSGADDDADMRSVTRSSNRKQ
jgi:hypothetical protein